MCYIPGPLHMASKLLFWGTTSTLRPSTERMQCNAMQINTLFNVEETLSYQLVYRFST